MTAAIFPRHNPRWRAAVIEELVCAQLQAGFSGDLPLAPPQLPINVEVAVPTAVLPTEMHPKHPSRAPLLQIQPQQVLSHLQPPLQIVQQIEQDQLPRPPPKRTIFRRPQQVTTSASQPPMPLEQAVLPPPQHLNGPMDASLPSKAKNPFDDDAPRNPFDDDVNQQSERRGSRASSRASRAMPLQRSPSRSYSRAGSELPPDWDGGLPPPRSRSASSSSAPPREPSKQMQQHKQLPPAPQRAPAGAETRASRAAASAEADERLRSGVADLLRLTSEIVDERSAVAEAAQAAVKGVTAGAHVPAATTATATSISERPLQPVLQPPQAPAMSHMSPPRTRAPVAMASPVGSSVLDLSADSGAAPLTPHTPVRGAAASASSANSSVNLSPSYVAALLGRSSPARDQHAARLSAASGHAAHALAAAGHAYVQAVRARIG